MTKLFTLTLIIGSASGRQLRGLSDPLWSPEPSTVSSSDDLWGSSTTIDATASSSDDLWGSDGAETTPPPNRFACLASCAGVPLTPESVPTAAEMQLVLDEIDAGDMCTKACSSATLKEATAMIRREMSALLEHNATDATDDAAAANASDASDLWLTDTGDMDTADTAASSSDLWDSADANSATAISPSTLTVCIT